MNEQAITALVTPIVESRGLEVDRIELASAGSRSVLRINLDGEGADGRGPSLDDIARATRAISEALDTSTVTGNAAYVLEVSSRGVGRPLTEPKHYRRNVGRLVLLKLVGGEKLTGRIKAISDAGVQLDVEGTPREVALDQINKAVVQVELNRLPDDQGEDAEGVEEELE